MKAPSQAINGKVYTFEPVPSTYAVLKKNNENLNNVHVQQTAVSGVGGSHELFFSASNLAENFLLRKAKNSIEVSLVTLKEAFDMNHIENVDLMKIDCEGAEYDILFNAGDNLSIVQKIVMEVHEPKYFDIPDKYTIDLAGPLTAGASYSNPSSNSVIYYVSGTLDATPSGFPAFNLQRTISGSDFYNQGSSLSFTISIQADLSDACRCRSLRWCRVHRYFF